MDFGAQIGARAEFTGGQYCSADLAGGRHAQAGHDVHDLSADGGLDLLGRQSPSTEAAPDQLLVAHHGHLAQGAAAVVDRPLPAQPTTLVDQLDVAVTLRGGALGRVAPWRAASTRRPPPASSRASGRRADAAPHRSSTSSRPGSAPSGFCDDGSRWPCKASGSGFSGMPLYPPEAAHRQPPALYAPTSRGGGWKLFQDSRPHGITWLRKSRVRGSSGWVNIFLGGPCSTMIPWSVKQT